MIRGLGCCLLVLAVGCATTSEPPQDATAESVPALSKKDQTAAINHYLSSLVYQRTGELDSAITELRKAADLSPESTDLQVRLLGAYYLSEDFENAAAMAERAVEEEPDNIVYQIWRGRIYYQLGRFDEAMDSFRTAIEIDPNNALAYERLAEIEEETNDLVGAIGVYRQMLEISPDSAFLHYRLGLNLIEIADTEGAEASLTRALELNPRLTTAEYLLAVLDVENGDIETALSRFERFLADNPTHTRTKVNIAAGHARLGNFTRSFEVLTEIIESADVDTSHHLFRTYILLREDGDRSPSLAAAPNGAPLLGTLLQALVRKAAGEPYESLINSLDKIDGDLDSECTFYLSEIITLFGREDAGPEIVAALHGLEAEGLRSRTLQIVLGRALLNVGDDAGSVDVFNGVINTYGSEKWVHYYLATAHDNLDQSNETERHLRACIDHDPNDPDVLNFLGYHLAEEDRKLDEAEKMLDRALQMDPGNGFYLDSLGWIYYRQGRAKLAVEYIRNAIQAMSSDDAILREHLGDAYLLNGETENAVNEWRRAIQLDPNLESAREKIEKYLPQIAE